MVAQTKADARAPVQKAAANGQKVLPGKDLLAADESKEDQVAAAATVDAAEAAAEVVAASGVMPTDAPADAGIGTLAQATTGTATDAAPAAAQTPATEAPAADAAAVSQPPPVNPWILGGAALLGVGAIAAASSSDNDSPTPPPVEEPPPPPPPIGEPPAVPPPNTAPVLTDRTVDVSGSPVTALESTILTAYFDTDGNPLDTITISSITPIMMENSVKTSGFAFDSVTGKGYELVDSALSWEAAQAAAQAKGGYLAVLDTASEMAFINQWFNGLGLSDGSQPTWIGLIQNGDVVAEPDIGWMWVDGTPFTDADPEWDALWNDAFGAGVLPNNDPSNPFGAMYGAIYDGADDLDTNLIFDKGHDATFIGAKYLIEYDNAASALFLNGTAVTAGQTIEAAQLANLTWNAMFNEGGSFTYTASDGQSENSKSNLGEITITQDLLGIGSLLPDPNLYA